MSESNREIRTLFERTVYENKFVTVFDDDVEFPSGVRGTYFRTRWKAPYGVAVLPVVGGEILLIENFRYSERAVSLEIPQGFGVLNSTPVEDARRELHEETGMQALSFQPLLTVGQDFKTHVFSAEIPNDCSPTARNAEATEGISGYRYLPVGNIGEVPLNSLGIFCAVTISAILTYGSARR